MIILASQSASRKAMLDAAGVAFEAVSADVDERALEAELEGSAPGVIATALAQAKARAVSTLRPDWVVLGGDSLVTVEGKRFDKPRNREDAAAHLRFFSGNLLNLHSAAALVRNGEVLWKDDVTAAMKVRPLSEGFIQSYLDQEWPAVSGCVGVFRIEGPGVQLFESIEGDHFTVLGMPLLPVLAALRKLGELPS